MKRLPRGTKKNGGKTSSGPEGREFRDDRLAVMEKELPLLNREEQDMFHPLTSGRGCIGTFKSEEQTRGDRRF